MSMSITTSLSAEDFYGLLYEGLDAGLLCPEDVLERLITYKLGVLADTGCVLNDMMAVLESHI